MRIVSDTERLLKARDLENRSRPKQASAEYRRMGNEHRKPAEKKALWDLANKTGKK